MDIEQSESINLKPVNKGLGFSDRCDFNYSGLSNNGRSNIKKEHNLGNDRLRDADVPPPGPYICNYNTDVKNNNIIFNRFYAWILDLTFIFGMFSFVFLMSSLLAGLDWVVISPLFDDYSFISNILILFSIFYIGYFTISDIGISIGKRVFNLKLVTLEGNNVDLQFTFLRSFLCLFSVFALFIPLIFDFQGKLSNTKIIQTYE